MPIFTELVVLVQIAASGLLAAETRQPDLPHKGQGRERVDRVQGVGMASGIGVSQVELDHPLQLAADVFAN